MPYIIALALLMAFVANVAIGAFGSSSPVGIVTEMLILFGAAISFSVGILRSEALEKPKENQAK